MSGHAILQPAIVLIAWTLLIQLWMGATRLPAMYKYRVRPDPTIPPHELTRSLPASVRWKADNYNHLMEQPTLFYALTALLALTAPVDAFAVGAAWTYVALRAAHSLVQTLVNHIPTRFALFVLSTLALAAMVWQGWSALPG